MVAGALSAQGTIWYAESPEYADVLAVLNQAQDGDTVIVPSGSAIWTQQMNITKGIALQGQTTTANTGTGTPTWDDQTIIIDQTPRSGATQGILRFDTLAPVRITGFTFRNDGTQQDMGGAAAVKFTTTDGLNPAMRIDHCHFDHVYLRAIQTTGWVYGVADHNVVHYQGNSQSAVEHGGWGNETLGWGSWADFPYYGTEKFFFFEDNTLIGNGIVPTSGAIDSVRGGRYVARHNYFINCRPGGHGTEGGISAGERCHEVYDNIFEWSVEPAGQQRSGGCLWHDNQYLGVEPNHLIQLATYREGTNRADPVWGFADGTSPWDINDTEGDNTYVEGHPPFLHESGTATGASVPEGAQAAFTDNTQNWTPGQWVGFSVKNANPNSVSFGMGSAIVANTATTITYVRHSGTDVPRRLNFAVGDDYEIHRLIRALNQPGLGKGDLIRIVDGQPINTVTGTPWQAHEQNEPCYQWNNMHMPTWRALNFSHWFYHIFPGRDYFDLGIWLPPDTTPQQVSDFYTAAVNGVPYQGTFQYPHPLQGGPTYAPSTTD